MKNEFISRSEVVFCDECGVLIKNIFAFNVKKITYLSVFEEPKEEQLHFCRIHKKPYKIIKSFFNNPDQYFTNIEVDKNGKPVKN
jgi:hypothetical protein